MADQYTADTVDEYAKSKDTKVMPARLVEGFTMTKFLTVAALGADKVDPTKEYVLGDFAKLRPLEGKTVCDLACGDGHYTRKWVELYGAESVVASDVSSEQIDLAKKKESEKSLGIEYHVANAVSPTLRDDMKLSDDKQFDVVTAVWLDPYMENADQLQAVMHNVYKLLKPGGIFVQAAMTNTHEPRTDFGDDPKYRTKLFDNPDGSKGDRKGHTFVRTGSGPDDYFKINLHWWSNETYTKVTKTAGFVDVVFNHWQVSTADREALGSAFQHIHEGIGCIMTARRPE